MITSSLAFFYLLAAAITPVFLTVFASVQFGATKLFFVLLLNAVSFAFWTKQNFAEKAVVYYKNRFSPVAALLALMVVITTLFIPTIGGKTDAILGQAGFFLAGLVFFLLSANILTSKELPALVLGIAVSSFFLSLIVILSFAKVLNLIIPVFYLDQRQFLAGEIGAGILIVLISFLALALFTFRRLNSWQRIVLGAASIFTMVAASCLIISARNPSNWPLLLPFAAGWTATIEFFKNARHALIGFGFNQFINFAGQTGLTILNTNRFFGLRFYQNSNAVLELINSLGLLGFTLFVLLTIKTYLLTLPQFFAKKWNLRIVSLGLDFLAPFSVVLISFFFLPFSPLTLFLLFFHLSAITTGLKEESVKGFEKKKVNLVAGSDILSFQNLHAISGKDLLLPKITAVSGSVVLLFVLWKTLYLAIGEKHFLSMMAAVAKNQGNNAYEEGHLALGANPYRDSYRISLSQINFQLASTLSAKDKLTDQQKNDAATLFQQAVSEAQNATILNPQKVTNWENLGDLTARLLGVSQEAPNIALSAYSNAVALEPFNPRLRLKLAQVLIRVGKNDEAINELLTAVNQKQDYADAYYNLAIAYSRVPDYDKSEKALTIAKKLVATGSKEEEFLKSEETKLSELKAKETAKISAQELTIPQAQPTIPDLSPAKIQLTPAASPSGQIKNPEN